MIYYGESSIYNYYYVDSESHYKINKDDYNIIKYRIDEFLKSCSDEEKYRFSMIYNQVPNLSICHSCIRNVARRNEIANCISLPLDLCNLIYDYSPDLRSFQCKMCNINIEYTDITSNSRIVDTNTVILNYSTHLKFRKSDEYFSKYLQDVAICHGCANKLVESNICVPSNYSQ